MTVKEKKVALAKLFQELAAGQKEMEAGPLSEARGTELEAKAQEAEQLQTELDQYERVSGLAAKGREVEDPALPATPEQKRQGPEADVAGYVTAGQLFAASKALGDYIAAGMPVNTPSAPIAVKGFHEPLIPLTKAQREAVEAKAVPTLGTRVINPDRLTDVIRADENDETVLRDLLNVSTTSSNLIEYLRRVSFTRAAAMVAETATKPEAATEYALASAAVRTLAVWIPVTEQMLADAGQVVNLIDNDLLYDLRKLEEEQVMYGPGTGQNFLGICKDPGVLEGRTEAGDTNLDKIRRAITDVRKSRYQPNGVVLDPIDWEGIVLLKGTDEHYIWVVVTGDNGSRVWGLRVVESVSAEEAAGNTTEERNIVVGDFMRGATLWDRQQATIAVGWINDQFVTNQRTIRAEERAAFAVRAPLAFRKIVAEAAVA
jgi:HK97 family phage major capsid protein